VTDVNSPQRAHAHEDIDDVPCDCAPTAEERRGLWSPLTRRGAITVGALSIATIGAIAAFRGVTPAQAAITYNPDDYPTWDDVERARNDESAKAGEVTRIQGLITQLQNAVAAAQAAATQAADDYYAAQQEFFEAAHRADDLQAQADEQSTKADEAAQAAAKVAAKLSRSGGDSTAYDVLFAGSGEDADEILAQLGQLDKLAERNQSIYADAVAARDSAQHLTDQAEEARKERDRLQKVAEEKMEIARQAQVAAEQALADQQSYLITLEQQLAALQDNSSKTLQEYKDGVAQREAYEAEQRRLEEERRRKAAEEAARRAEEERQRQEAARKAAEEEAARQAEAERQRQAELNQGTPASPAQPAAPAAPNPAPVQPATGWVRPNSGVQTAGYGWRSQICGSSYCSSSFHEGVDLAAGCGASIVAASAGTVEYAGYNGGYGNYIRINHGGGVSTGYAHIVNGGVLVGYGQYVEAGTLIAYEGNTGNSFGCHLHFEVYINGATTNPIDFMAGKGISV